MTVQRSRWTALLKAFIHVLPLGISLFEIVVNLRGRYVGGTFDQQGYYQLAAKAHEILIDASLTTIVYSCIRRELTSDGIPFGAFLGGLQFLSVSYLWSRELWSSAFSGKFGLRIRINFVTIITICCIIAATAGPSSAILLIPRQTLWPLSPTYVAINGTFQDIYPDRLDSQQIPKDCSTIFQSSGDNQSNSSLLCPGND